MGNPACKQVWKKKKNVCTVQRQFMVVPTKNFVIVIAEVVITII